MNTRRIYAIFLRYIFLLRHNPTRFINIFLWVVLDIVLWGFITKYLTIIGAQGFNFSSLFLGAIILWGFLIRVQQGVMQTFFEDVWSRNFLNLFASPLTVFEYLAGLVAASVVSGAIGFSAALIVAGAFFGFTIFNLGALLLPFLLILFTFGVSLGILASAIVLWLGPSAEWFAWPIPFLVAPFAGVFYPVSTLPPFLESVAYLLPPSYVFEGMRSVVLNGTFLWEPLGVGVLLAFGYLVLMYFFFVAVYRRVLRTGTISRFTAETG